MFDQIAELVKSQLTGNSELASSIPQEQTGEVHQEIAGSVIDGLKKYLGSGGSGNLLSMLAGKSSGSADDVTQNVSGGLIERLTSKFGLSGGVASSLAASIIPGVIQKFFHKAADPNDSSLTPQDVMNHLSDGKTSDLNVQGAVNSIQQGDHSNSSVTDLLSSLGGSGGSGILGNVMGMFK